MVLDRSLWFQIFIFVFTFSLSLLLQIIFYPVFCSLINTFYFWQIFCERFGNSFRVATQGKSFMDQGRNFTCNNKILEVPIILTFDSPQYFTCVRTTANSAKDSSDFYLWARSKEVSNTTRVKQFFEKIRAVFRTFNENSWHKKLISIKILFNSIHAIVI